MEWVPVGMYKADGSSDRINKYPTRAKRTPPLPHTIGMQPVKGKVSIIILLEMPPISAQNRIENAQYRSAGRIAGLSL